MSESARRESACPGPGLILGILGILAIGAVGGMANKEHSTPANRTAAPARAAATHPALSAIRPHVTAAPAHPGVPSHLVIGLAVCAAVLIVMTVAAAVARKHRIARPAVVTRTPPAPVTASGMTDMVPEPGEAVALPQEHCTVILHPGGVEKIRTGTPS